MSIVDVLEVKYVSENPSAFDAPLRFEVTFECLDSLEDDLEWKIVYVGSAEDQGRDQVLEEVMVGPVPLGTSKFVLEAPPPSFAEIPRGDRLGVTVVSITCAYLDQPFVSVGYYVNNEYFAPGAGPREGGAAVPPEDAPPDFGAERVFRNLCADQPRVTRYAIKWAPQPAAPPPPPGDAAAAPAAPADDGAAADDGADDDDGADEEEDEDDEEDEEDDDDAEVDLGDEDDEDDDADDDDGGDAAEDIIDDSELPADENDADEPAAKKLKASP